jgi:hypothetical protein
MTGARVPAGAEGLGNVRICSMLVKAIGSRPGIAGDQHRGKRNG